MTNMCCWVDDCYCVSTEPEQRRCSVLCEDRRAAAQAVELVLTKSGDYLPLKSLWKTKQRVMISEFHLTNQHHC